LIQPEEDVADMLFKAGSKSQFLDGQIHPIWVGRYCIGIVRVQDRLIAFLSACPHRSAELVQGKLENEVLTCPWHEWRFDLATGRCMTNPHANLNLFNVTLEGDEVYVEVPDSFADSIS
jgi:nitrite reductase/ring-hydroxylating ferredoxin subunit